MKPPMLAGGGPVDEMAVDRMPLGGMPLGGMPLGGMPFGGMPGTGRVGWPLICRALVSPMPADITLIGRLLVDRRLIAKPLN